MYERQLYEVPRFLTTEEVAEMAGMTVRAVKNNGTRKGWSYGMGRDGVRYWDVSSFSWDMPERLFDGFLRHDAAIKPLRDAAQEEALLFCDILAPIRVNAEYMTYYGDGVLLCRALEIIQDAVTFMPGLYLPYACTGLYFHTGIACETLEAFATGKELATPIFGIERRFWLPILTEWVRRLCLHGQNGAGQGALRVKEPASGKSLRHMKPAVAVAQ